MRKFLLAGVLIISNAALANQNLKCFLDEVKIEIDADGDVHRLYTPLNETSVAVVAGEAKIERYNDTRYYYSAYLRGNTIRVFIRDKQAMGALNATVEIKESVELHLSDPGPHTEPGLQLTCNLK